MENIEGKVKQIFQYLKEVNNLNKPVERTMDKYEIISWENQLPIGAGCCVNGKDEDAWLEVHQQEIIINPPELPTSISEWVENSIDNPEVEPKYLDYLIKRDQKIFFEDDQKRIRDWQDYVENKWRAWADEIKPKIKVQRLYSELFVIYQRLEKEPEHYELLWGHGLLSWKHEGEKIARPTVITPLELIFDAEKAIFKFLPTSKGSYLEIDMLGQLYIPYIEKIEELKRGFENLELDPRNFSSLEPILSEFVHLISFEGQVIDDVNHEKDLASSGPVIENLPVVFLRKKSSRIWDQEFTNILEQIDNDYRVPDAVRNIVSDEVVSQNKDTMEEWRSVGEELLFPLLANEEQKEIARRLSKNIGVAVQGPPGTGKSHTIANLICHLLAHGKRVLVTSQTERALKVLGDKIPEDIRSLCASVMGGDSESIKRLEDSIQKISEKLSGDDSLLEKNIDRYRKELYECRDNLAQLKYQMKVALITEYDTIKFNNQEMKPIDVARWLQENEHESGWIKDDINYDTEIDLSDDEMVRFFYLAGVLEHDKIQDVISLRPDIKSLPTKFDLEECFDKVQDQEKQVKALKIHADKWDIPENLDIDLKSLKEQVDHTFNLIQKYQKLWLRVILEDVNSEQMQRSYWRQFKDKVAALLQEIYDKEEKTASHDIIFPEDKALRKLKEDYGVIKNRLQQGKKFNFIFKNFSGKEVINTLENTYIDNEKISRLDDASNVILKVETEISKNEIELLWEKYLVSLGAEKIDFKNPRTLFEIKEVIELIEIALKWEELVVRKSINSIKSLGVPQPYMWTKEEFWEQVSRGIDSIQARIDLTKKKKMIEEVREYLTYGKNAKDSNRLWSELLDAINTRDIESYKRAYDELVNILDIEKEYYEFENIKNKLIKIAPIWTSEILSKAGTGKPMEVVEGWHHALEYTKLRNWLKEIHKKTNTEALAENIQKEKLREQRLIESLVSNSTWYAQINRTTDTQRRSLIQWVQFIRKAGKRTGKYAEKHMKNARKEMAIAKGAIPVWIMPMDRVVENLNLDAEPFDVVIIDESSQCNLFALSVLMRAKKVVIVGDDNQISPAAVGVHQEKVNELIRKNLDGIPQKNGFDLQTSLFDIGVKILPGQLMLKEHFRCVPEIIQFSNDLMYGGNILPLRLPSKKDRLESAVKAVRVENGRREEDTKIAVNLSEVEKIVADIKAFCTDEKYKDMTMGVISLQGYDQAKRIEQMLIEEVGPSEMKRRKLICGDAYDFQGDERDIIFMSMVAAGNVRIGALTKRADMQRFNVAASRAKNQSVLYHSVDLDDLNPQCMRALLLGYYLEPGRTIKNVDEVKHLFDSKFEEDVFKLITARGYSVTPQVKVGRYRIDLVVEGLKGRLAVECDGDRWHGIEHLEQDQERQWILERAGWEFFRIRGGVFYLNPKKSLEPLWIKLSEI